MYARNAWFAWKSRKGRARRVRTWVAISVAGLCLALPVAGTAMQLPPEIEVDRYLLQAEEQIEKQDFRAAKEVMDRILQLQSSMVSNFPRSSFSGTPKCWTEWNNTMRRSSSRRVI